MGDADGEIIRILAEMRDLQRKDLAYRRKVMRQSLALARRGVRMQRLALLVGLVALPLVGCGVAIVLGAR